MDNPPHCQAPPTKPPPKPKCSMHSTPTKKLHSPVREPKQINEVTWENVSLILRSFDPTSCMAESVDFGNKEAVHEAWKMIMDAVFPHDGRVHLVHVDSVGNIVIARNQPAAMPRYALPLCYPNYGQLSDEHLRILNQYGIQNRLGDYTAAVQTLGKGFSYPKPHQTPLAAGSDHKKLIRRSVQDIYNNPKWKARILNGFRLLRDDTKRFPRFLKETKMVDLGEWGDFAAIHGGPYNYYSNAPKGLDMWCWHHCFQFLPWHRPWLAALEAALAEAGNWYSDDPNDRLGLPYWDVLLPYKKNGKDSWENGHPLFFEEEYLDVDGVTKYPNPLCPKNTKTPFDQLGMPLLDPVTKLPTTRQIVRGWEDLTNPQYTDEQNKSPWPTKYPFNFKKGLHSKGQESEGGPKDKGRVNLLQWMIEETSYVPGQTFYLQEKRAALGQKLEVGQAGMVENVHDMIHNNIGPDCQNATLAAWDPILYFFHSNIDRQLQKIIDDHNQTHPGFFAWLCQVDGQSCGEDMTILHIEVPYPPVFEPLMLRRLKKTKLPCYKDCFTIDYFNYIYDKPYQWPTCEEFRKPRTAEIQVHFSSAPHDGYFVRIRHKATGAIIGTAGILGMTMNNGGMRMLTPVRPFTLAVRYDPTLFPNLKDDDIKVDWSQLQRMLMEHPEEPAPIVAGIRPVTVQGPPHSFLHSRIVQ